MSLFGHPVIVLNSMEAVKDCSLTSSNAFNHRPVFLSSITMSIAPGIAFRGVDDYLENRRFVLTNLKRRGMGRAGLEPQILEEAELLISHLRSNPTLDPEVALKNFTSNTVMTMCFGKRWEYEDPRYKAFAHDLSRILRNTGLNMLVDFNPVLGYLPAFKKANKETTESVKHIRMQFEEIIKERVNGDDTEEHDDIISEYIGIHKVLDEDHMKNIVDICHDLFFAGSDTTAATTGFALIHLVTQPAWQAEVAEELERVLEGRSPSVADLQSLPKMEATIQETLRVNPNVPFIFHATSQATRLREYVIPADCMVMINACKINYNPVHFPSSAAWQPRQWLDSEVGPTWEQL